MTAIRCIGICTGSGDAPGLNAVIRAVLKSAILNTNGRLSASRTESPKEIPNRFGGLHHLTSGRFYPPASLQHSL